MKKFKHALSCLFSVFFCTKSFAIAVSSSCGDYQQQVCRGGFCTKTTCQNALCKANLTPSRNNICTVDSDNSVTGWRKYAIDGLNNWKYDDLIRDKLNMDSTQLSGAIVLQANTHLNDGRYIYVLRANDANMIVRPFDRDEDVKPIDNRINIRFEYPSNRNINNYRLVNKGAGPNGFSDSSNNCMSNNLDPPGKECAYKHVRHSQLNGTKPSSATNGFNDSDAWNDVYCAGELRVFGGKIDIINTNSGHFKPDAACIENVKTLLAALDIDISPYLQTGRSISTAELYNCRYSAVYNVSATPLCVYQFSYSAQLWREIKQTAGGSCFSVNDPFRYWRHGKCEQANKV